MSNARLIPYDIQVVLNKPIDLRNREDIDRVRNWICQSSQLKELAFHALKNLGNNIRYAAAEDVLQEFCMKRLDAVIKSFKYLEDKGDFWAYLKLCLKRFCHRNGKMLQKEKKLFIPFSDTGKPEEDYSAVLKNLPDSHTELPDKKLSGYQFRSYLEQIMNKLEPKYREVLVKYYFEDKTLLEIAKALNISNANAKIRLMRARQQIRKLLLVLLKLFED